MLKPNKSKDQMKTELLAALDKNPDMGIKQMMSFGISESMCYKLRRQVRAIAASAESIKRIDAGKVENVVAMLRDTRLNTEEIRDQSGVSKSNIALIAKREGVALVERARVNRRKPQRRSKGSGNGHIPMVLESMSGDGLSFEWARYNMGHVNYKGWNYWGCGV